MYLVEDSTELSQRRLSLYAIGFQVHVRCYILKPTGVLVSRRVKTLENTKISVPSPFSKECGGDLCLWGKYKLWYPFHAPRTDTMETWLNGDGVWWVSLMVAALSFCKSTMHLEELSFLSVTTILDHQNEITHTAVLVGWPFV